MKEKGREVVDRLVEISRRDNEVGEGGREEVNRTVEFAPNIDVQVREVGREEEIDW